MSKKEEKALTVSSRTDRVLNDQLILALNRVLIDHQFIISNKLKKAVRKSAKRICLKLEKQVKAMPYSENLM
ncbi:MAG: hypothetical protein IT244_01035 [Bacteroidia bacterium]|jgi:hypothetical protein|nr:hypothetical protein [Bacteroidia bacterium]